MQIGTFEIQRCSRLQRVISGCLIAMTMFLFVPSTAAGQQKIQKDERLGVILSFTAPGFGQIYAGNTWRGIGIAAAEAICAGVVVGVVHSRKIKILDVNGQEYEVLSTKDKKLSSGEAAAVVSAAVAGLGIYIWQLFDASKGVKNHNKALGFDVGMTLMEHGQPGVKLHLDF